MADLSECKPYRKELPPEFDSADALAQAKEYIETVVADPAVKKQIEERIAFVKHFEQLNEAFKKASKDSSFITAEAALYLALSGNENVVNKIETIDPEVDPKAPYFNLNAFINLYQLKTADNAISATIVFVQDLSSVLDSQYRAMKKPEDYIVSRFIEERISGEFLNMYSIAIAAFGEEKANALLEGAEISTFESYLQFKIVNRHLLDLFNKADEHGDFDGMDVKTFLAHGPNDELSPCENLIREAERLARDDNIVDADPNASEIIDGSTHITRTVPGAEIMSYRAKAVQSYLLAIDKLNAKAWTNVRPTKEAPIVNLLVNTKKRTDTSDNEVYVIANFSFQDYAKINPELADLDKYDERVYFATASLALAGNQAMSPTQVYKAMGYKGKPGKNDLEKIKDRVMKMSRIYLDLSNEHEIGAGYRYPATKYKGALLPAVYRQSKINGTIVEDAFYLATIPVLAEFAIERKQFMEIPLAALQSPLSNTELNLEIEDYVLRRIGRSRQDATPCKITFESVFKNTHTGDDKFSKTKTRQKVKTYMEYLTTIEEPVITSISVERDGVRFELPKAQEAKRAAIEKAKADRANRKAGKKAAKGS